MTRNIAKKITVNTLGTLILIGGYLFNPSAFCQSPEVPLGSWRTHLSYENVISLAISPSHVYGATEVGILVFDRADNSLSTYNKLSGLTGSGITVIEFDQNNQQLIIAYENGDIDFLRENSVTNFSRLKDLNTVTGSHRINDITINDNFAYFSTDYGIVVFDLAGGEIKETWRDLGREGTNLAIRHAIFYNDSIAVATDSGIMTGNLQDNLLDFSKWQRFDTGELATPITDIAFFDGSIFAAVDGQGIYRKVNGAFARTELFQDESINALDVSASNLLISTADQLWVYSANGILSSLAVSGSPQMAREDPAGTYWIADSLNGLTSNVNGDWLYFKPNGPSFAKAFRLRYTEEKIFAVAGGYGADRLPAGQDGAYNIFDQGLWYEVETAITDATDILSFENKRFIASYGAGLAVQDQAGNETVYDDTNSTLQNTDPTNKSVYVTALAASSKLWLTNYGADASLHTFSGAGTFQPFSFDFLPARYPLRLVVDPSENVWMAIDSKHGGGIFVRTSGGEELYRVDAPGSGDLPDRNVNALAVDQDGSVWFGTNAGVGYFFSEREDAIKPIFENRFLLKDEKITAIAVDGGNRKWIGTEKGAWLFNPTGDQLLYNFTEENSPLLSNVILDITIHEKSGEVFFSTAKGIISFRSDASAGDKDFKGLKIFPNPVTSEFTGTVGISGLAAETTVKITDINGRAIAEISSNGGTAAWNLRDFNGSRPRTGVYLVFAASPDGAESVVGKIALID
jgi:hypothetical protein